MTMAMAMAMGGFVSFSPHPDGDGRFGGDYGLGRGAVGELAGAQENWEGRAVSEDDGSEPDMLLDEFFDILQEDPASVRELVFFYLFVLSPAATKVLGFH